MEYFFILLACLFLYFWLKPKKELPIDISKDSAYYEREFPDIIKPAPAPEKPTIIVNITNNHLHVYPKDLD